MLAKMMACNEYAFLTEGSSKIIEITIKARFFFRTQYTFHCLILRKLPQSLSHSISLIYRNPLRNKLIKYFDQFCGQRYGNRSHRDVL